MFNLTTVVTHADTLHRLAKESRPFRFTLPYKESIFKLVVGMDIMKLDKWPVPHIVFCDTKFIAVSFPDGVP